eukprot:COSAG01_NODE_2062_length_8513_cov_8.566556_5_plen_174_part_00
MVLCLVCQTTKDHRVFAAGDGGAEGKNRAKNRAAMKRALAEETEGVATILKEEGLLDADAMQQLDELDSLTAKPVAEDVVLHAVAMCAPWVALQSFKYKVKLTPGKMKKGKAVKQIRENMLRLKDGHPLEKQCLKSLPDPDLIRTIISNITIPSTGGATKKQMKHHARKQRKK